MKKVLALCMSFTILLAMTACSRSEGATVNETNSVSAESSDDEIFTISAGGIELKYPLKWKDKITVTTSEDCVCFACGETKLFDLTFNTEEGSILGTVESDDYVVIRIVDYAFESDDQELYEMQEDVNVILQHLMSDYTFAVGEAVEKEDTSTFDIETSVVTMKYPAKWQESVQINVSDDGVKFSNNGTPLFDLMFIECDGYLLGTYSGTPIYIIDYSVETDEQAAMQEDVNVILQYLMEDKNFVISQ